VNEVVPKADVLARATEIAERLAQRPLLQLRYSRAILTELGYSEAEISRLASTGVT